MPRHSKNNTSSAQFTYAERAKARKAWGGTATAELGSTAQRPWSSCVLCLAPARRPTVDAQGHLFCRECVLSDLVTQKDELARIQRSLQALADRKAQKDKVMEQRAHERRVQEFEARQGLTPTAGTDSRKRKATDDLSQTPTVGKDGQEDQAADLAQKEDQRIRAQLAAEEAEAKKSKLPSFWLPSLTPSEQQDALELGLWTADGVPTKPMCRAGKAHPLTIKQLVNLHFWRNKKDELAEETPLGSACPTCQTEFVQSSQAYALRSCGHVLCRHCANTLVLQPSGYKGTTETLLATDTAADEKKGRIKAQCAHCDAKIKDLAKDLIPLQREGTGYAAAGNKVVVKKGVAFHG